MREWLESRPLRIRRTISFIVPFFGATALYFVFGFIVAPRLWPEVYSPKTVRDGLKVILVTGGGMVGWIGLYIIGRAVLDWYLLIPLNLSDKYE